MTKPDRSVAAVISADVGIQVVAEVAGSVGENPIQQFSFGISVDMVFLFHGFFDYD
jgi:hypothetical protein